MKKNTFLLVIIALVLISALGLKIAEFVQDKKHKEANQAVELIEEVTYLRDDNERDLGLENDEVISSETETISNHIIVSNLVAGDTISTPVLIEGEARGTYYFEGSFPIELLDDEGELIAQGLALAQSDWLSEDFVPFSADLEFSTQASSGYLVLQNDNPSGLAEYALALTIPVNFVH